MEGFPKSGISFKDITTLIADGEAFKYSIDAMAKHLKDILPTLSEEEQLELLSTNGMLVKRPILETKDKVLVGFKEEQYKELL